MRIGMVLAGIAMLVAGCGGDSSTSSSTATGAASTPTRSATPAPNASPTFAVAETATVGVPVDEPAGASAPPSGTPELPTDTETPTPASTGPSATPTTIPVSWMEGGKWHHTPANSTCVYNESKRTEALYRDFANAAVILMDSENCRGTWYLFYPSTGEAFGGLSEPDNARLRLRLSGGKVMVVAGTDGCAWTESRRQNDFDGALIVVLQTTCGKYDYAIWYFPATGELNDVVA